MLAIFLGKMVYELDNKKVYEIFRDFTKKNPKIYDENSKDISNDFNIDKTRGNQFFVEQTKIDDIIFSSTALAYQQEIVLDEQGKNNLTQKIANILTTGEENISYNKSINKLNKKINEEIGTDRTIGKPKNILAQEELKLINEKKELQYIEENQKNIKFKKIDLEKNIDEINLEKNIIKEIKNNKENTDEINKKIQIKSEYLEDEKNNLNKLNEKTISEKKEINNKSFLKNYIIIILLIINILSFILFKNKYILFAILSLTAIYLIYYFISKNKTNKLNKENNNIINKINNEKEILGKNIMDKSKEIETLKNELNSMNLKNKQKIKLNYSEKIDEYILEDLLNLSLNDINKKNEENENELIKLKLEINTLNIEEKNNIQKLERKAKIEEELIDIKNKLDELNSLERVMNLIKNSLENAYEKIKENITPKFTKNLEEIAKNIIGDKYKKIKFNDNELIVELENRRIYKCK